MKVGAIYQNEEKITESQLIKELTDLYFELPDSLDEPCLDTLLHLKEEFNYLAPPYLEFLIILTEKGNYFAGFYPEENFVVQSQANGVPWVNDLFTDFYDDPEVIELAISSGYVFSREWDTDEDTFQTRTRLWECEVDEYDGISFTPVWRM